MGDGFPKRLAPAGINAVQKFAADGPGNALRRENRRASPAVHGELDGTDVSVDLRTGGLEEVSVWSGAREKRERAVVQHHVNDDGAGRGSATFGTNTSACVQ